MINHDQWFFSMVDHGISWANGGAKQPAMVIVATCPWGRHQCQSSRGWSSDQSHDLGKWFVEKLGETIGNLTRSTFQWTYCQYSHIIVGISSGLKYWQVGITSGHIREQSIICGEHVHGRCWSLRSIVVDSHFQNDRFLGVDSVRDGTAVQVWRYTNWIFPNWLVGFSMVRSMVNLNNRGLISNKNG